MKPSYEELVHKLAASQREFRAADATIENQRMHAEKRIAEMEAKERQNAELAASLKQVVSGYKYLLRTARPEMMIAGNIDIQQAEKLIAAAAGKGELYG